MSVFLTPTGVPFYGGTYFPPTPRHGLPAFVDLLRAVAQAWQDRRADVEKSAADLLAVLQRETARTAPAALAQETLEAAVRALERTYDLAHGGWGAAPKFPQPMTLEFLLRMHVRTGEGSPLRMVQSTLAQMARGGIFDHLGGGFHRYATDANWLVPHFEKMLYDNAQLARVYTHAWQVSGDPLFRRVAEETLDYVLREMTDPAGGFYSSQDADSEGVEGKFFVWTPDEVRQALGEEAELFIQAYGITPRGNFDGTTVLHLAVDAAALAAQSGAEVTEIEARLAAARRALFVRRQQRVRPALDDKVLVAWNGLALSALAEAARVFGRSDYRRAAEANAAFLLSSLRTPDGRLLRVWRAGQAKIPGYLEDYACLADGLLALYETTFDARWFVEAQRLADAMLVRFRDPSGGFFDTSDDHERLVVRPKDLQDNATPSGGAMAAAVLLRLAAFTGERRYRERAEEALGQVQPMAAAYPTAFAHWLCALEAALARTQEIAIVGHRDAPDTLALLDVVRRSYHPNRVVAAGDPREHPPIPLLAGRESRDARATAYVCENFVCRSPITDPAELATLLA
jgi:uncharacterized protein YyaL (SSP411 family)